MQKFIATGRVGGDAEIRLFPDGTPIISFSLACSEKYKDKNSGEEKEHTEWINIEMTGKGKDKLAAFITKGRLVLVDGKMATKKWSKDGVDHYKTVIRVQDIEFLGPKDAGNRPASPPSQPQPKPAPKPSTGGGGGNGGGGFGDPDDIPFVCTWDIPRRKRSLAR